MRSVAGMQTILTVVISLMIITVLTLLMPVYAATSLPCIQAKNRQTACPHQLYRADKLPSQSKVQVLCICFTDFSPFITPVNGEQQQIEQNMSRRQFEAQFGSDLTVILAIVKRQR
jgi:hypothetical protein